MYVALVHFLQDLKPAYILLVQSCLVIAFPFFLWRVCRFEKIFPLGVVQIFSGVLLGPAIFGAVDATWLNPASVDPVGPINACTNPDAKALFNALFGVTCYGGQVVNRAAGIASVATIAVCLFGFLAGADADKELVRKSGKTVVSIGLLGMAIGWGLGIAAGFIIFDALPAAVGAKASRFSFSIAYGLVIAVSALPVLALILRGLDITRRRLGAVALASASLADTVMWLGLGVVVALTLGGSLPLALAKAASGALLSIGFIKWIATPIFERLLRTEAPESAIITFAGLSIFIAAAITGITELHPVLGAFVAGYFLPNKVREMAAHRLDLAATLILMPFFFLNTGLNTKFSFSDWNVWILFGVSSVLCVVGKMVGHGIAARVSGEGWPFSLAIGMLLQTKGLMGIIVIVVFFEKEVVSPTLFAAAVFMCMFSTGLTTPALVWAKRKFGDRVLEGDHPGRDVLEVSGPIVSQAPPASVRVERRGAMATLEFDNGLGTISVNVRNETIGRSKDSSIRINDVRVSGHHATLVQTPGGRFEIHNQMADRSQRSPISINGVEKDHAVLTDGDKVSLNGVGFTFRELTTAGE